MTESGSRVTRWMAVRCAIPAPRVALQLGWLLVMFCLARLVFFFVNRAVFASSSLGDLLLAFAWGLRFDISFLLVWNLPFVLWGLLGGVRGRHLATLGLLILNSPPLWWNLADAAYFPFQGRRSTLGVFNMWQDMRDQAFQLLLNFWHIPLLSLLATAALAWGLFRAAKLGPLLKLRRWQWLAALPITLFLVFAGIRSSVGSKPLGTWNAMKLPSTALGNLALNTPFYAIHTDPGQSVLRRQFFPPELNVRALVDAGGASRFPERRSNVVVLILESFSLEHFGYREFGPGYMPFLKSLSQQGAYFENSFANGRQSIDAIASVLAGIPSLMVEPYVSSIYNGNRLRGLGHALGERGYATAFFHGGRNGTMYLDVMSRLAGFTRYFGQREYPEKGDFDGTWGIFDEPYLQYVSKTLSSLPQPFAAGVFTLSSHNPYRIPDEYRGRFPKGTEKIHESLGYADFALRRFFETASREPWYRDTLFVLTGDHTSNGNLQPLRTAQGLYRVPLIFFHPGGGVPQGTFSRVVQHADVPATVLDLLGINRAVAAISPFGRSAFEQTLPGRVVNRSGGYYWMVSDDGVRTSLSEDGSETKTVLLDEHFLSPRDSAVSPDRSIIGERELKAFVQLFDNGIADNHWFSGP